MCIRDRKRWARASAASHALSSFADTEEFAKGISLILRSKWLKVCLLYTSDAADERSSVDLGGSRIIKKKKTKLNNDKQQIGIKKDKQQIHYQKAVKEQHDARSGL